MRRTPIEIVAGIGASVLIATAVVAAGGALRVTPAPLTSQVTEQAGCSMAPLFELDGSGIGGRARLCIVDEGVKPALEATGLTPGIVYTSWLAYFDHPADCKKPRCTLDDVVGDDPVGVVGRMDGLVADGTRKAHFWADFRDLRLASGSEVRLLVFGRGQPGTGNGRRRARQLLTLPLPALSTSGARPAVDPERLVAQAAFELP